jgi:hypothetical protein
MDHHREQAGNWSRRYKATLDKLASRNLAQVAEPASARQVSATAGERRRVTTQFSSAPLRGGEPQGEARRSARSNRMNAEISGQLSGRRWRISGRIGKLLSGARGWFARTPHCLIDALHQAANTAEASSRRCSTRSRAPTYTSRRSGSRW